MGQKSLKCQLFHIWAYVFGHNSAIFWPIGLNLFMATQKTIIYRVSIGYKESWFWALIAIFNFWALLKHKKGRGPTDAHMGKPKSCLNWRTFWATCFLEIVFIIFFLTFDLPLNLGASKFCFLIKHSKFHR